MVAHIGITTQPIIMRNSEHNKSVENAGSFFDVLDSASKNIQAPEMKQDNIKENAKSQTEENVSENSECAEKSNETVKKVEVKEEHSDKREIKTDSFVAEYLIQNPIAIVSDMGTPVLNIEGSATSTIADENLNVLEDPVVYSSAEVVVTEYSENEKTSLAVTGDESIKNPQIEEKPIEVLKPISDEDSKVLGQPKDIEERAVQVYDEGKIALEVDTNEVSVSYNSKNSFVSAKPREMHTNETSTEVSSNTSINAEFASKSVQFTSSINAEVNAAIPLETKESNYISSSVRTQVINQISENLQNVSTFKNEFSFTVNPEHLGKIAVKMIVEDGTLTVELSASSKETQSILASNLDSIKEILKNLSTDNQVMQTAENTNPDYLQQQDNSNKGNSENQAQNQNDDDESNNEMPFTENFLSMLNIFNAEKI